MGQEQLNKVGSFGREEEAKLYRWQVLTLLDKGHFLHGLLPVARYDLSDPENQATLDSIRAVGILQPGEVWHFEDTGTNHVIFGERRTILLDVANQEKLEQDQDPIPMRYRFRILKTLTPAIVQEALARKADENNQRKGNDWLTICHAVKQQLRLGVDPGLVLARWPMIESEALMERMAKDTGITAAIPAVQEALAYGRIKLRRALAIADLPLDKQADELVGKKKRSKSAEPKAIRLPVLKRLREEISNNKTMGELSASTLLDILTGQIECPSWAGPVREILTAASKPGRKSEKKPAAEPKSGSEFTEAERAMIHANNNKDIDAIEAAEEKKNKRGTKRDEDREDEEE